MLQFDAVNTKKLLGFDVRGRPLFDIAIASTNACGEASVVSTSKADGLSKAEGISKADGISKAFGASKLVGAIKG